MKVQPTLHASKTTKERLKRHPDAKVLRMGLFQGVPSVLCEGSGDWLGWFPISEVKVGL